MPLFSVPSRRQTKSQELTANSPLTTEEIRLAGALQKSQSSFLHRKVPFSMLPPPQDYDNRLTGGPRTQTCSSNLGGRRREATKWMERRGTKFMCDERSDDALGGWGSDVTTGGKRLNAKLCIIKVSVYLYSALCDAPMMSEKCSSHLPVGKSLGWDSLDQSPSKMTSYLASSHAQQGSLISSGVTDECSAICRSQSLIDSRPVSMDHTELEKRTQN